jgi:hypothetical protein
VITGSWSKSGVRHLLFNPLNVGIAISVFGAALTLIGITGTLRGPSTVALADALRPSGDTGAVDCCTWLHHWHLWGIGITGSGALLVMAGTALASRRRWGFLLLTSLLMLAAIVPWALQAFHLARYPYERPNIAETLVYVLMSAMAAWGYVRRPGIDAPETVTPRRVLIGYLVAIAIAGIALGRLGVITWVVGHDGRSVDTGECHKAYSDWNDTTALKRCETTAKSGDAEAQFGYGLILWSGPPDGVNRGEALEWLRKSAQQGHWLAQVSLGGMLQMPELDSTLRNRAEAFAWLVISGDAKGAARLRAKLSADEIRDGDRLASEFVTKYSSKRPGPGGT